MKFLLFLSDIIIPLIIFYIVGFGFLMKRNVYEDFVKGAKDGLKTVFSILPTLIGLMVGVGILRSSGLLEQLAGALSFLVKDLGVSPALIPLIIVKMFSSSAATGLLLDIYREYGADSSTGATASLILSSTETVFYTMSVYFMAARVTKTRYTLAGSLLAAAAGVAASIFLAGQM
ncbi:MAG: nucleoside recognition domain-containing protein [Ruminococcus sp.]|jgi:spore maturation protein B